MNLLVADSFVDQRFLADSGEEQNSAGYVLSGFIPIISTSSYKFLLLNDNSTIVYVSTICAYDENGQFMDSVTASDYYHDHDINYCSKFITSIPNNAKYIKCCFYMQDGTHPMSYFTKELILNTKPVLTYFRSDFYNYDDRYSTNEILEQPIIISSPTLITKTGQLQTNQITEGFSQANIENFGYTNVNQLIEF